VAVGLVAPVGDEVKAGEVYKVNFGKLKEGVDGCCNVTWVMCLVEEVKQPGPNSLLEPLALFFIRFTL
jgi:hypothetical protein